MGCAGGTLPKAAGWLGQNVSTRADGTQVMRDEGVVGNGGVRATGQGRSQIGFLHRDKLAID